MSTNTLRRHKLMTEEILKKMKKYPEYSQDGKGMDAIVTVKFFSPYAGWRWYATEYSSEDKIFFGLGEVVRL